MKLGLLVIITSSSPEDRQQLVRNASEAEKEFFTCVNVRIEIKLQRYTEAVLAYCGRIEKLVIDILPFLKEWDS